MTDHALLLVDLQNDFLPGGALAVPQGDEVTPIANHLIQSSHLVVATQDWHPANHGSFAANHKEHKVFDLIELHGLPQVLWPVHCVQNTGGACFAPGLETRRIERIFPKGLDATVDSYSGFFDNGRRQDTGMSNWLKQRGIRKLSICGLALDYCVKFTALDAITEGFEVELVLPACRGVNLAPDDCDKAVAEMREHGITIISHLA